MMKRRQFLGLLTSFGGSYILTACGGGSEGISGDSPVAKSTARASAASANGTTIPSASSIIDNNGSVWTLSGGSVYLNGVKAGNNYNVTLVLWYGGTVYHQGTGGQFYAWNGTTWFASGDPRLGGGGTSADGTTIPPASQIIDTSGAVWTVVNGVIYRNGSTVGNTYNVSLLLWFGGSIYHQGTGGQFYGWNGSSWNACNDPRLGGTSADGTTIPSATYIIDKTGAIWTVVNGVIYRNRATVGNTYNVSLLLWYGGKIWHRGTGGQFYVLADLDRWLPCDDPRLATSLTTAGSFYGVNGHFDYTYTPAQLVAMLKNMGCTSYRVGCTDDPLQLNAVAKLAQAFQAAGLTLFVLVNQGVYDATGNLLPGEGAAYNRGFAVGMAVAKALQPYGVTLYECGNELTRQNATVMDFTYAGTKASDFNNANWPVMRGVMRGMIDGVKSVQPSAKCGINFCVADVGAADALWDGMQPDGSGGYPKVRWDVTTWHNYEVYGNIFNIGVDGAGPGFDLPTYCKARYGVPFIISEWNTGPEKTEDYRAAYISSTLASYYRSRKSHNIQSVMYYVLDSGNNTYGIMINGTPISQPYSALSSFIAANADS